MGPTEQLVDPNKMPRGRGRGWESWNGLACYPVESSGSSLFFFFFFFFFFFWGGGGGGSSSCLVLKKIWVVKVHHNCTIFSTKHDYYTICLFPHAMLLELNFPSFCYLGIHCDVNIDECNQTAVPCNNGGTCVDGINGYSCQCPPRFSGPFCNVTVTKCSGNPCQNGATCVDNLLRLDLKSELNVNDKLLQL